MTYIYFALHKKNIDCDNKKENLIIILPLIWWYIVTQIRSIIRSIYTCMLCTLTNLSLNKWRHWLHNMLPCPFPARLTFNVCTYRCGSCFLPFCLMTKLKSYILTFYVVIHVVYVTSNDDIHMKSIQYDTSIIVHTGMFYAPLECQVRSEKLKLSDPIFFRISAIVYNHSIFFFNYASCLMR